MKFAWVLNLDAELELSRPNFDYVPRTKLLQQLAIFGQGSRALLAAEDALLEPGTTLNDPEFVGRAWCPTPQALSRMAAAGVRAEPHPTASVLRRVNHRLFAHEAGGGLFEQRYFTERAPLEALLRRAERPWLLKRPLSFAGRGQMRFYGPISDKQWAWLDLSLARDGLIAEPLVTPTLELSLHGFVWQAGRYELGRACVQQVSERGVFRGVRLALAGELERAEAALLFERAEAVARLLHQAGYFGPFGIDAYRYRVGDEAGFCALSEINARYTMGFAVGFPRPPAELSL
ncbi:MAG TPA: hypothetical protein VER12_13550 [Polyangiaceae bacterium]|nr:hypothetical protein [Polyangiaceae bacterium]HYQ29357.1 hypothetical protein [Polyangiaceae bacterium]